MYLYDMYSMRFKSETYAQIGASLHNICNGRHRNLPSGDAWEGEPHM